MYQQDPDARNKFNPFEIQESTKTRMLQIGFSKVETKTVILDNFELEDGEMVKVKAVVCLLLTIKLPTQRLKSRTFYIQNSRAKRYFE